MPTFQHLPAALQAGEQSSPAHCLHHEEGHACTNRSCKATRHCHLYLQVRAHRPTCLVIDNEGAALLLKSRSAPFSGVIQLKLRMEDASELFKATALLQHAAKTIPGLRSLRLGLHHKTIYMDGGKQQFWSLAEQDETFM